MKCLIEAFFHRRDICDEKIFSAWKRKKLCEIASQGKQKLFDKENLQNANGDAYRCEKRFVLFVNIQPDPRMYSMFRCPTNEGEYYLGRSRNDNEVAVYVPLTKDDTQCKGESCTDDERGVEPGRDKTAINDDNGVQGRKDEPSLVFDEDDALKRSKNERNSKQFKDRSGDDDDNIESEEPFVSEEIGILEELENVLPPPVRFYGIMKGIDLQTLGRVGAKLKVWFNEYF